MDRNKAIEVVKSHYTANKQILNEALETLIPELKERDDEKIRKQILSFLKEFECDHYRNLDFSSWIAWLERKGEQDKQHLYDVIVALWDLLDKIDTFSDLKITDMDSDNPFRKLVHIAQERHKLVKSDGYDLFIDDVKITNHKSREKQCECVIECPQNHQESNRPSGGIVLEDFNGGEGFYKLNLAYLNKKQVEEVEEMVREWNNEPSTSEEDIKDCIGLCLTDADEQRFKNYHTNLRDCLAWLEKQGGQNTNPDVPTREVILSIWDLGNEWKELTNGCISTEHGTQLNYIQKHWHESECSLKEKQGKKKTTDKVKSKFNQGDWVIDKQGIVHQIENVIENMTNHTYGYDIVGGGYFNDEVEGVRLWTIDDAKDGDVIVCDSKHGRQEIGIVKRYVAKYGMCFVAYCFVDWDGIFRVSEYMGSRNIHPATKEQRDALFAKMKDEGYEWDAEKKELKKI